VNFNNLKDCNHPVKALLQASRVYYIKVIWEQDINTWEESTRINLDGPFHRSRLIVKEMVKRGYCRVVYISMRYSVYAD